MKPRRILAALVSVATALAVISVTPVSAAWVDEEWVSGREVATLKCEPGVTLPSNSASRGTMLSGSLLGIDLDSVAEVSGVDVHNDGGVLTVDPPTAQPVAGQTDAYADPLRVEVLSGIVGLDLTQFLQLPLTPDFETGTGVYGQFAQASSAGEVAGAAGLLTQSGAINTDGLPAGDASTMARLDLASLVSTVNADVAGLLSNVANLGLELGAVGARAELDACDALWAGDPTATLTRDYMVASADLVIETPLVGNLVSAVTDVVDGVQNAVDGLTYGVLAPLLENAVTGLLDGVLGALGLGGINIRHAEVGIDLGLVRDLLNDTISDPGGVLSISLATGEIRVNTVALLAAAYEMDESHFINGLPPNTDLLGNEEIGAVLNTALEAALSGWIASVDAQLERAVSLITVNIELVIKLRLLFVNVADLEVSVTGTLDDLKVGTNTKVLGALDLKLLDPLINALVGGLGGLVAGIINGTTGIVRALPGTVTGLTGPILVLVSDLYNGLFLSGIVQVLLNAQNASTGPSDPPLDMQQIGPRQFDVAAVRVGVLNALGDTGVRLYLARASVETHP